jgi:hypothetical protein
MADRENNQSHQPPQVNRDERYPNYYPRTPPAHAHPSRSYEFLKDCFGCIFLLLTFLAFLVLAIFLIIILLLAFKPK